MKSALLAVHSVFILAAVVISPVAQAEISRELFTNVLKRQRSHSLVCVNLNGETTSTEPRTLIFQVPPRIDDTFNAFGYQRESHNFQGAVHSRVHQALGIDKGEILEIPVQEEAPVRCREGNLSQGESWESGKSPQCHADHQFPALRNLRFIYRRTLVPNLPGKKYYYQTAYHVEKELLARISLRQDGEWQDLATYQCNQDLIAGLRAGLEAEAAVMKTAQVPAENAF